MERDLIELGKLITFAPSMSRDDIVRQCHKPNAPWLVHGLLRVLTPEDRDYVLKHLSFDDKPVARAVEFDRLPVADAIKIYNYHPEVLTVAEVGTLIRAVPTCSFRDVQMLYTSVDSDILRQYIREYLTSHGINIPALPSKADTRRRQMTA